MTDNTNKPESTWGIGDSEAETRIAGSTPAGASPVNGDTQRFEEDATQMAPRDASPQSTSSGDGDATTQTASGWPGSSQGGAAQTDAAGTSSQAYPSAPQSHQQEAPYSQGYPGAAGQYTSSPQTAYGQSGAYGQQGGQGQQYGQSAQQYGQQGQYGSAPQGGGQYASYGQYQSSQQAGHGQQYPSAPQGGYGQAQNGQYSSAPQGGYAAQQYGSAPQGQYGSAPQGGQYSSSGQYASGAQYNTPPQQAQYTSAAYGQSHNAPAKTTSAPTASPIAKFGPFLPALLGLIAPFVTWVTFKSGSETVALNGIGGNSNAANASLGQSSNTGGIFVLILAIGLAIAGVLAMLGKLNAKVAGIITAAIGAVMLILALAQFGSASSAVSSGGGAEGYSATIGAGVWLTLLAGLAALAVGIVALLQGRKGAASTPSHTPNQPWNNNGFTGGQQQFGGGQQQFGRAQNQQFGQNNGQGFGQNR